MTTATEQLQIIANAWAQKLGGRIGVVLRVSVYSGQDNPTQPMYSAEIGGDFTSIEKWYGFGPDVKLAQSEAERKWALDGTPTDPRNFERARLLAKCRELGIRVEESDDEPVIYNRGELPPADTRTEHDKSL